MNQGHANRLIMQTSQSHHLRNGTTLRGYVRRVDLFKDHAGAGFL
jgi:hypothetical protein